MKFRCERDTLFEALSSASRAVSSRSGALAVLSGIKLTLEGDQLTIVGSDLDLTISVSVDVGGDEDGVTVLPSRLLVDIVRALGAGAITLESTDGDMRITAARSEFTVRSYPPDEYPALVEPPTEGISIPASSLTEALRQVVPAASKDDSRPILTGVLLATEGDALRLVATDSYRLSVRDVTESAVLGEDQTVLIPSRALTEVARLLDDEGEVTLGLTERDASFRIGTTTVVTRLIEGEFPNYRGLIPDHHPNRMTVNRLELLDAVRRVRLLAQETTPVRLTMSSDGLDLKAITQDVGEASETIDGIYDGEELTVAFNPEYLIDGTDAASGDEVVLETVDALKPALIRTPEEPGFLYLLMPVRVS
ncbi:MAG: DNA polymerase III subunit beta [Acidobacteria bacterium]|nr:DNA polymerase III subunit beta [Acidobacteriota bacterium]